MSPLLKDQLIQETYFYGGVKMNLFNVLIDGRRHEIIAPNEEQAVLQANWLVRLRRHGHYGIHSILDDRPVYNLVPSVIEVMDNALHLGDDLPEFLEELDETIIETINGAIEKTMERYSLHHSKRGTHRDLLFKINDQDFLIYWKRWDKNLKVFDGEEYPNPEDHLIDLDAPIKKGRVNQYDQPCLIAVDLTTNQWKEVSHLYTSWRDEITLSDRYGGNRGKVLPKWKLAEYFQTDVERFVPFTGERKKPQLTLVAGGAS